MKRGDQINNTEVSKRIRTVTEAILKDYELGRDVDQTDVFSRPDNDVVMEITLKLFKILYPGFFRERNYRFYNYNSRISVVIEDVIYNLQKQIGIVLGFSKEYENATLEEVREAAVDKTIAFFEKIPEIRALLDTDLEAFLQGDPAAFNKEEIVLCYPGFFATTVYRVAHELFLLNVPLIPRMMTEFAHNRTGIDIHPGATIGKFFFMDHGTGIVVGETSIIGERVKIYQGVTIGALSTRGGQSLRGKKRHPTIEDEVTIYGGATILGGETVIGKGSVIGGNVFITSSVKPGSRVSVRTQELLVKRDGQYEEADTENAWFWEI